MTNLSIGRICLVSCKYQVSGKFKKDQWHLDDAITGSEALFYWNQPKKKHSNESWITETE